MTLTFPRTDILDGLHFPASTPRFKPLWRQEISRTAGGVTRVKDMGPLLWNASYLTVPMPRLKAGEVEADLLSLDNGGLLFKGYDPARPFPASDSTAALTGVTVRAVRGDRRALSLTGLPAGFTLTKGDWVSVDDGSNLHLLQAVETITGSTWFEVRPGVRADIAAGDAVTLRYASAYFMVDPGSVERADVSGLHDTVSWTATQVFI